MPINKFLNSLFKKRKKHYKNHHQVQQNGNMNKKTNFEILWGKNSSLSIQ